MHDYTVFECHYLFYCTFAYTAPEPRFQLVEQEPKLFSSPVDEVIVSIDENVVMAAAEPDGFLLDGRIDDWKNEADEISM